ncbi:GNAT family N-acetyltransferase [Intrasporangium sp. DVR]|uniref:GNAT family N-acetyltransferase n=1 Tax=Intrasporangium sp. DVR TaxID=3127867 RepID=UPI00313A6D53
MSEAFELRPLDPLDDSLRADAQAWVEVHCAVQRELFGQKGSAWTLPEIQAMFRKVDTKRMALAAWVGDRIVGAVSIMLPMLDNHTLALLFPAVLSEHRHQGVGSALVRAAEEVAAQHDRSTTVSETEWAAEGADIGESFAQHRGYVVAQTVLRSEMALPAERPSLQSLVDAPGAPDHLIESVVDDLPESWLEDRALLQQRMSTDAPHDDMDWREESWDADRLRAEHAATRSAGRRVIESVARHVPSGRLVGFTRIEVSAEQPGLGYQQDTLVLVEHRGHSLGARLKAANVLALMEALPEVAAVRTWNAASNDHMLAVNRALGYHVDGYSRLWQKRLG